MWCGAYIGEVIKLKQKDDYVWESYESYTDRNPEVKEVLPCGFTTRTLLVSRSNGKAMTMPINKVFRFLTEGDEHNIYFYVEGIA